MLLKEWNEEEKEKNYPLIINGQDELNPTEEPNQALDRSSGWGKARPELSSRARWFDTIIVPPRTPHGMSECSDRPQV